MKRFQGTRNTFSRYSFGKTLKGKFMKLEILIPGLLLAVMATATVSAQVPAASKEHKILKMEEGEWEAKTMLWMGPTGLLPEPLVSSGKETNRMIGDFWTVSDFSGDFGGMPYTGHGQFGYDAEKGKYVGTWIDSFSPNVTMMEGTWDAEKKTMTYMTTGMGMDGNPSKGKNVVVYESDDKRTMTMYMASPEKDAMDKVMMIEYTRAR